MNSCVCDPPLARVPTDYQHSAASFYMGGDTIAYLVMHHMNMKDINFEEREI